MKSYELITILGPTASGKTTFAAALAAQLDTEIISADSRQIYRSMDIGTGKDLADYNVNGKQIPYHLIDICEPGYKYNVFEYQHDFFRVYEDMKRRGKLPILCGGTGMYIEAVLPKGSYIQDGLWKIRLIPEEILDGQYDLWLPAGMALNRETRFLAASPDTTLTIPSTASRAISVGAYDDATQAYADFSGRGFARLGHPIKPELAAPGVNIITARAGGGYEAVTGTSFAAPFVTGSAALMMQWGIVNGNDPYLYGEKLKAYLIRGARSLPGETVYPNERLGYGALCLERSFPL